MKHILSIFITSILLQLPSLAQPVTITIDEVPNNVGKLVRICDKVYSLQPNQNAEDKTTILNFGSNHADSVLLIVIPADARKRFDYRPDKDLLNRQICITGKIEMIEGKKRIVITKQDDIVIKGN